MESKHIVLVRLAILVPLLLLFAALLPAVAVRATGDVALSETSGYVGDKVRLTGTIDTLGGMYTVTFDGNLSFIVTGQAQAGSLAVDTNFFVPPATGSDSGTAHNVILTDSTTSTHASSTLTVKTNRMVSTSLARLQEGTGTGINVMVTGGVAKTEYSFDIQVKDPGGASHTGSLSLTTVASGSGTGQISYPAQFPSDSGANTNFVGSYSVVAKETSPGSFPSTSGSFQVGLTAATAYLRFDQVAFQSSGWMPGEQVTVDIQTAGKSVSIGKDVYPITLAADKNGTVSYTTATLPASASTGTYTLTLTSADKIAPTVKNPTDTQDFPVAIRTPAIVVGVSSQPASAYQRTETAMEKIAIHYLDGSSFNAASLRSAGVSVLNGAGTKVAQITLTAANYNATQDLWSVSWKVPKDEVLQAHTFSVDAGAITDQYGNTGPAPAVASNAFAVDLATLQVSITHQWEDQASLSRTDTASMSFQAAYPDDSLFSPSDLGSLKVTVVSINEGQSTVVTTLSLGPNNYNTTTGDWTAQWTPAYNAALLKYQFQVREGSIADKFANSNSEAASNLLQLKPVTLVVTAVGTDRSSYERDQTVVFFVRAQYLDGSLVTTGSAMINLVTPDGKTQTLQATPAPLHSRFEASIFLSVVDALGTYTITLPTDALTDAAGNQGPAQDISGTFDAIKPVEIVLVQTDVGSLYFAGEQAQFTVLTADQGTPINVDSLTATLVMPDGSQSTLTARQLATGLYRFSFNLPTSAAQGTYTLMVTAHVSLALTDGKGTTIQSFQVSKSLSDLTATITQIQGGVATIQTDIGTIKTNLFTANANIVAIQNGVVSLQTDMGTVKTGVGTLTVALQTLSPVITEVRNNIATIHTDLGDIKASLAALDGKVTAIQNGVATIQTNVGTMQADLTAIHAQVTDIHNGQATIQTDLGTVRADLATINPKIASISNGVATIQTDVGTVKTDVATIRPEVTSLQGDVATVKTDVGTVKGTVTSMQGDVATIKTDVGTIKARVPSEVAGAPTVQNAVVLLYIVAGLALVAAVGALGAVRVIIRRLAR